MRPIQTALIVVAVFSLTGCLAPPVESPKEGVSTAGQTSFTTKTKVDILFMIDNSSSMDPMQLELRGKFGQFLQPFQDLAAAGVYADLHIGVVTSDYGAGDLAGGGCDASPGGDRGILRILPAASATNPPAGCAAPTGGERFIRYRFAPGGNADTNLPNGSDLGALVDQFTCMASVGAKGCGFEHQLESVYAALHDTSDNPGFLRADALLVVVFVTNEDDGSAPPTAKFYEQANDPGGTSTYGQYTTYRQTRFAVECNGAPIPYGVADSMLQNCAAKPNPALDPSAAFDVSRYISFFTEPAARGGVKVDPNDVILVGIDGPETPFSTVLVDPAGGNTPYQPCAAPMLSSSCIQALQHSCENAVQPGFFADPAVRLNAVIGNAPNGYVASICGDDVTKTPDFSHALTSVAERIRDRLQSCFPAPIADRPDGTPDCAVEDVVTSLDGQETITEINSCAENGGTTPCWRVVDILGQYDSQGCTATQPEPDTCKLPPTCQPVTSPTGQRTLPTVIVDREPAPPPSDATTTVSCAIVE